MQIVTKYQFNMYTIIFIYILCFVQFNQTSSEFYSAIVHLKSLAQNGKDLAKLLNVYLEAEFDRLSQIKKFASILQQIPTENDKDIENYLAFIEAENDTNVDDNVKEKMGWHALKGRGRTNLHHALRKASGRATP